MCQTLSDKPPAGPISFISMNTYAKALFRGGFRCRITFPVLLFPVLFEQNSVPGASREERRLECAGRVAILRGTGEMMV